MEKPGRRRVLPAWGGVLCGAGGGSCTSESHDWTRNRKTEKVGDYTKEPTRGIREGKARGTRKTPTARVAGSKRNSYFMLRTLIVTRRVKTLD